ncbi:MAG: tetratricopeptide repeat protein [Spirochaetales bacterium]|nr:tetratricopeptide repeat protein [Spirochaetales bacterium]
MATNQNSNKDLDKEKTAAVKKTSTARKTAVSSTEAKSTVRKTTASSVEKKPVAKKASASSEKAKTTAVAKTAASKKTIETKTSAAKKSSGLLEKSKAVRASSVSAKASEPKAAVKKTSVEKKSSLPETKKAAVSSAETKATVRKTTASSVEKKPVARKTSASLEKPKAAAVARTSAVKKSVEPKTFTEEKKLEVQKVPLQKAVAAPILPQKNSLSEKKEETGVTIKNAEPILASSFAVEKKSVQTNIEPEKTKDKKSNKKIAALLIFLLAVLAGGGFFVLKNHNFFGSKDNVVSELSVEEKLALAQKLIEQGNYEEALKILLGIDASGNSEAAKELRNKIYALINEAFSKALENGREQEILDFIQSLINNDEIESALKILNAIKVEQGNPVKEKLDALKKSAVDKAVADGKTSELLSFIQQMIDDGNFSEALELLNAISIDGSDEISDMLKNKIERMKKQAQVLQAAENLSDEEKLALAQKLIDEGKFEEALILLNSLNPNENNQDKINALKKEAVEKALQAGIDLGEFGFDENGNPILSEEEILRHRNEAKNKREIEAQKIQDAKNEAERKALEEKKAREQKALEAERQRKAAAAKKAQEEKFAREAAAKKAEAERKAKEKAIAEQNAKEAALARQKQLVENYISHGKQLLSENKDKDAVGEFYNAEKNLPAEEKTFAGKKLGEAAIALFDSSEKKSGSEKKFLHDEAVKFAEKSFDNSKEEPNVMFILGMNALERHDYASAENFLRNAAKKDPGNSTYFYQLGRVLAMQKKYNESLAAFQTSIKINGNFAPAHYNSGFVCEKLGKNKEALASYRNASKIKPDYENAFMGAGHILAEEKNYSEAVKSYSEAVKINPSRAQTYQELGSCYSELKNYSLAEQNFLKALSCPDSTAEKNALTYYNLSTVMFAQDKKNEAFDFAKKAYDNKEKTSSEVKANISYNLGLLNQESGNENEAIKLYQETLNLDSNHVKANTNLGMILLMKNQPDAAIALLVKAYKNDSKNFEVNNNLGSAYRDTGDFSNSVKFYKNALDIEPENMTVKENLAKSYTSAKDYKNARTIYEELVKKQQTEWPLFFELAKVCLAQGDGNGAEKYLLYLQSKAPDFKTSEVNGLLAELQ